MTHDVLIMLRLLLAHFAFISVSFSILQFCASSFRRPASARQPRSSLHPLISATRQLKSSKEDDGIGASIVPVLPPPPPRGGGLLGPALHRMDEN